MRTDVHYVRAKGMTVIRVYKSILQSKQNRREKEIKIHTK
jgi:hypothetical protein